MEKILTQDNMPTLLTQLKTKMDARYASISSTAAAYEEGTFTPVFKNAAGTTVATPTSHSMLCYYKKIGKICIIHISADFNGEFKTISGLPFASAGYYVALGGAIRLSELSADANYVTTVTPLRLGGTVLTVPGSTNKASSGTDMRAVDGAYPIV